METQQTQYFLLFFVLGKDVIRDLILAQQTALDAINCLLRSSYKFFENSFFRAINMKNNINFRLLKILSMITKLKCKNTEESNVEVSARNKMSKNNNYIIEYIVSLSGLETQKVYLKHGFLGRGGFANCFITQLVGSNRLMATKIIEKNNLKSSRTKLRLISQIKIHKTFSHPNIVEFLHYFEDYDNVYIMLQLCQNESLNQLLKERKTLTYPEVQSFIYGICNGVKYLHEKKFIHRDLKLGNIFLNDKFQIKIGDFGLTSQLQFLKENKRTVCGTPNYIAPEVLEGTGYYFQVDIWGIGIILYTLLYGFPPFESENTPQIYTKIRKCQFNIPKNSSIPIEAINLIKKILVPQPQKRPSIEEILNSPFMKMGPGIPLQLPQCCYSRAPTKSQIQSMPLLNMKDNILKQTKAKHNNFMTMQSVKQQKHEKSTMDKTISRDCNVMMTGVDFQDKQRQSSVPKSKMMGALTKDPCKSVVQPKINGNNVPVKPQICIEHIIDFQQINQNSFYFCTSKYVIGTYEKQKQICFRHLQDFQKSVTQIHQLKLYNNLFSEQGTIPFLNFKHKALLSLKAKQLIKSLRKQNYAYKKQLPLSKASGIKTHEKLVFIARVNVHKQVIMIKLSNKCIQVIYDAAKHGFLYDVSTQKLYYYQSLSSLTMKELVLSNVIETVVNYIKTSEKCSKAPNFQTCVPIVNSNQYIKMPISKLKHIYGIISELQNKTTKHNRNRNSQ